MIDTHCHLFESEYDDLEGLIGNIKNEGIENNKIIKNLASLSCLMNISMTATCASAQSGSSSMTF